LLTVIVPAYQAAHLLPDTLGALARSSLPRAEWELIVVDDGSTDATSSAASAFADRVITLEGNPRGPGAARNEASKVARGDWLVFIDADVRVHGDTLARFADHARAGDSGLVAVFGAYDDMPAAEGLVSQYRNLLHRYVHLRGAGEAETFWAGCGAVLRSAFDEVGGFDIRRFPRPQIEDIELGYRLRDAGGRILLDPAIQGTHLKRWTVGGMLRTDIRDRGIPWMRLLLERRGQKRTSLNTGGVEQVKVALAAAGFLLLIASPLLGFIPYGAAGILCFVLLLCLSVPALMFLGDARGAAFAVAVVPLHVVHYLSNAYAATAAIVLHAGSRFRRARPDKG
jgi:glycosyltransferase involved in cell wall biosynthesis